MQITQAIERPFGINVFGSAIIRVEPDIASLKFAVSRLAQTPKEAFQLAHDGAQSVRVFLSQMTPNDFGASAVSLTQAFRYTNGESHFIGYRATIAFHVLLRDLNQLEVMLSGIVDAGVNEVTSTDLQTTQLKELRAEVRRRAVQAAREKAENYCKAAGVNLGPVIHIEDVSPDVMSTRTGHGGTQETPPDDEGTPSAVNPASIVVSAAVMISFELGR